jgi:DHA1 family tetracycline resistance protein-like MFS transporter
MKKSKAGIWFIFTTIVLDMIGIGLIIPTLPDIMRRFVSDQTDVTEYYGYFIAVYALMQFLAAPLVGALSDKFGRRPLLLISLFVAGFDYLLMAYAPNLEILFVGRILAGLTGASATIAMAYIADVSDDSNRSANFGLMGAAFGLGFIIGPALGGLLGHYGSHLPFIAAAMMNILNFLFGFFVLPESLPKEKHRQLDFAKTNPLNSFKRIFQARHLGAYLAVYFLFMLAGQTHPSIWTLYTEKRYGWTPTQIGLSLAMVGILSALAQGWLTRIIVPRIGEQRSVTISSLGYAISFACFGLATQGWMLYVILFASAIFWVSGPALQSLISAKTPSEEQGELQGTLVSLTSLAAIICPLVVTKLFAYFTDDVGVQIPGAPYFFGSLVALVCWFIMLNKKSSTSS